MKSWRTLAVRWLSSSSRLHELVSLGNQLKASITKATQQAKQAMKGHYDALGVYVAGICRLAADLVNAGALMIDTGVVGKPPSKRRGHATYLGCT